MSILAIIPARGGSKSIPNKNIANLAEKPLIAWTILASQQAKKLDRIVVTTDSKEIANIAKQHGAEVPFLRPTELAQDDTPGIAPILHAIKWLEKYDNYRPDFVMYLQPTSPLRIAQDIDAAIELALQKNADAVVSVTPVEHHPYWMKQMDSKGRMQNFIKLEQPITRRQDLPSVYTLNGAIYLARRNVLLEQQSWYTDKTYTHIMPPERSIDIDTPWDLYLANLILKDKKKHELD